MTKNELKKAMLEVIEEAAGEESRDSWYCTDKDVITVGMERLAEKLNIILPRDENDHP